MNNALLGRRTKVPVNKRAVLSMVAKGVLINCCGLGLALMAMQTLVAQLLMQPLALPDGTHSLLSGQVNFKTLLSSFGA